MSTDGPVVGMVGSVILIIIGTLASAWPIMALGVAVLLGSGVAYGIRSRSPD